MIQCLVKYYDFPTYISSQIVDQDGADFPAITVCPQGGFKLDVLRVYDFFEQIAVVFSRDDLTCRRMVSQVSNHTIITQKTCNQKNGLVIRLE